MYVTGKPRSFLRLEGLVLFTAALIVFASTHQHWWWVPILLFVPDIFMAGYVRSTRLGALTYNIGHTYLLPITMTLYSWHVHRRLLLAIGLIWMAHIGMDRVLGYGLKYDDDFKHTHLGDMGKK